MNLYHTLHILISYILCATIVIGCASAPVKEEEKRETNVTPLLEEIIKLNTILPHTISASFRVESVSKSGFKTSGKLLYNVDTKKARMSIVDTIFGSQLSVVVKDNETLYIYQPVEKNLLIFDYDTFPVHAFLPLRIDIELIDNLLIGKIPLLKNYYNAKAVATETEQYVMLENDVMHQTILLREGVPNKLLFITKNQSERYEIYFIKPAIENNIFTCKAIRLVDVTAKNSFEVTMQKYTINQPIPDDITDLKLPKNTKIVDYR